MQHSTLAARAGWHPSIHPLVIPLHLQAVVAGSHVPILQVSLGSWRSPSDTAPSSFWRAPVLLSDRLIICGEWEHEGSQKLQICLWYQGHLFCHFIGFIYLFILQLPLWLKLLKQLLSGSCSRPAISWCQSVAVELQHQLEPEERQPRPGCPHTLKELPVLWSTPHCTRGGSGHRSNGATEPAVKSQWMLKLRDCWKVDQNEDLRLKNRNRAHSSSNRKADEDEMSKVCSSRQFDQNRKLAGAKEWVLNEVVSVPMSRNQMSSGTKVSAEQKGQGRWVEDSTGRWTDIPGWHLCPKSGMEKPYLCGGGKGNRKPLRLRKSLGTGFRAWRLTAYYQMKGTVTTDVATPFAVKAKKHCASFQQSHSAPQGWENQLRAAESTELKNSA